MDAWRRSEQIGNGEPGSHARKQSMAAVMTDALSKAASAAEPVLQRRSCRRKPCRIARPSTPARGGIGAERGLLASVILPKRSWTCRLAALDMGWMNKTVEHYPNIEPDVDFNGDS